MLILQSMGIFPKATSTTKTKVFFIDLHTFWNCVVHECSFIVGIHLCVIISKPACHHLYLHLCPYSPLMQRQRHLEPIILFGDARSGRSGMSRSIWFQHEQSNAWRPTVKQRSPPFPIKRTIWKDQISNPSSLRYIINIFEFVT